MSIDVFISREPRILRVDIQRHMLGQINDLAVTISPIITRYLAKYFPPVLPDFIALSVSDFISTDNLSHLLYETTPIPLYAHPKILVDHLWMGLFTDVLTSL